MKRKRKLKTITIITLSILIITLIILGIFLITKPNNENNEEEKIVEYLDGYSEDAISYIKENNLEEKLKNLDYSKTLDVAITSNNFNEKNLDLYLNIEYKESDNFITNINLLSDIGYNKEEIANIFEILNEESIGTVITFNDYSKNLNNFFELSYFKEDLLERYLKYEKEEDLDYETIVTYVNIGLDNPFYTNGKLVTNPNDTDVLVNKYNYLGSNFIPNDLQTINSTCSDWSLQVQGVAKEAFESLCTDAKAIGLDIIASSTYRSYSTQQTLYNNYAKRDGSAMADTYSARAGHSEHQLGLALDVTKRGTNYTNFDQYDEFDWMQENAHLYGFILRYPKGKEHITGYMYESWHYRYLGVDLATKVYNSGLTYEEYLARQ